jgi:hypothetical protein
MQVTVRMSQDLIFSGRYERFSIWDTASCSRVKYEVTFRLNMSSPSSGPKNESSNKPERFTSTGYLSHVGFLLRLHLNPDDGGDMLLRNVA